MHGTSSQQDTSTDTTVVHSMLLCCTGKGRGVVATESIAPGQLLLCCEPLGVVTGAQQGQVIAYPARQVKHQLRLPGHSQA
jgi:hypothetical protein